MKKMIIIFICYFSFSQEAITLDKAISFTIENSHEIAIAKNNNQIINNNTSLGAAGMLPNLIISSGYNASLSNTNLEFNPFVDFGAEEIDVSKALSSSFSSSAGFNYTLFNGFNGIYTLKKFNYLDESSKENLRFQIENKLG